MQNEPGSKQPPPVTNESVISPKPPEEIQHLPEVQDSFTIAEKENEVVVIPPSVTPLPERVQDLDWNNGQPDSTADEAETLPAHKTAEALTNEDLERNKGNQPGDKPNEASGEVNVGQNAG
jgi:hypothetical protein